MQKNTSGDEGEGDAFAVCSMPGAWRWHKSWEWPSALSPSCVRTGSVAEPVPHGVCQGGQVLLFIKFRPLSSCPAWEVRTLGLTPFASCETSRTPTTLCPRRTPGSTERLHVQMETTRKGTFFLYLYIFRSYLGVITEKNTSQEQGKVSQRGTRPCCVRGFTNPKT